MSLSTGQALRKAREVRGISAADAARSAGISAAYLNRLENDTVKRPSPLVLDQLSEVLAVPYAELMEHIGAGLAAMGVIGPGIGIGILAGMAAGAIGRNPDAAGQIRGLAIILAAFAEGLGVLAIVVGLLAIFITG